MMADPRVSAALQATVKPSSIPADDATNPYYRVVSDADSRLQNYEMHPASDANKAWGAPTPSKDAVERSLSAPLLQSSAAVEARLASTKERLSPKLTGPPGVKLSLRPATAAGSSKAPGRSTVRRPTTAAGRKPVAPPAPGSNIQPQEGETFTATQIRKLEAEVEHLKDTIDVLLGSQVTAKKGNGNTTMRASGLRTSAGTLLSPGKGKGPEARAAIEYAIHEQNRTALATTLADKKAHDSRILALQKEAHHLSEPGVHAEVSRSAYKRIDETTGLRPTTPTSKPVVLPAPLRETPPRRASTVGSRRASTSAAGRRASMGGSAAPMDPLEAELAAMNAPAGSSRRASVSGGIASRRGSVDPHGLHTGKAAAAEDKTLHAAVRAKRHADLKAQSLTSPAARGSSRPKTAGARVSISESKESKEGDSPYHGLKGSGSGRAMSASRRRSAGGEEGDEAHAYASASSTSASMASPSARPRTAAPASRARAGSKDSGDHHGIATAAARTLPRPSSAGPRMSKEEVAAAYDHMPGTHKHVAEGTATHAFAFTQREKGPMSIREQKFWAWMEDKKREEDEALHFKFKAGPIAPATKDLDLYRKIMEKLQKKREAEHSRRAAELSSTVKPFTVVTAHCEDHAARLAANRAKFLYAEARELAEGRKFKAHPVPNLADPDGMFANLVRREQEREARVAAMAREFYAGAALPPRMALAEETERRKKAEREARKKAEEEVDKTTHAFHPNPLPDFDRLHKEFEDGLVAAKTATIMAQGGLTRPQAFGFDQPDRIAADEARKNKWIKEANLQTSMSMSLRTLSKAYTVEGEDLVPGGNPHATMRPGTAGGTLGRTGGRKMSATDRTRPASATARSRSESIAEKLSNSNAPPAAMTRSVQLKMLSAQTRIRELQEADLKKMQEDEEYDAFVKASTRRFAPIFQQMEKARVPEPLAWQMDKVTSSASAARQAFEKASRDRAAANKRRISDAQANRPLVMMQYALEQKQETARRNALQGVAEAAAAGASAVGLKKTWRSVVDRGLEGTQMFSDEEREVLGYPEDGQDDHEGQQHEEDGQQVEVEAA